MNIEESDRIDNMRLNHAQSRADDAKEEMRENLDIELIIDDVGWVLLKKSRFVLFLLLFLYHPHLVGCVAISWNYLFDTLVYEWAKTTKGERNENTHFSSLCPSRFLSCTFSKVRRRDNFTFYALTVNDALLCTPVRHWRETQNILRVCQTHIERVYAKHDWLGIVVVIIIELYVVSFFSHFFFFSLTFVLHTYSLPSLVVPAKHLSSSSMLAWSKSGRSTMICVCPRTVLHKRDVKLVVSSISREFSFAPCCPSCHAILFSFSPLTSPAGFGHVVSKNFFQRKAIERRFSWKESDSFMNFSDYAEIQIFFRFDFLGISRHFSTFYELFAFIQNN